MTIDGVSDILRELSARIMLPRFRQLSSQDIDEKTPGDQVTIVDHEMEDALARRLTALLPGSVVVGEEAVSSNPARLADLAGDTVWVVDPLDGTNNFVKGSVDFACMVVLLRRGDPVASWIHAPVQDSLSVAEAGSGAWHDGRRIVLTPRDDRQPPSIPGPLLAREEGRVAQRRPSSAAGIEYPRMVNGYSDFMLYWRTLPWDHLPGSLLVREAGGVVAHFDGAPYTGTSTHRGLLVAGNREQWDWLQRELALQEAS